MQGQTIYNDLDAEQAVLGAILFDNAVLESLPPLSPQHFHEPLHARLYADCAEMIQAGRLADPRTLRKLYENRLDEIGGAGYLLTLIENAARLTHQAIAYVHLLGDLATKRAMQRAMQAASASMLTEPALDALGRLEADLRGVQAGAEHAGSLSLLDELEASLDAEAGLATGYPSLDRRLGGLHKGDLILLAARPSMGKSAVARNIAMALAWRGYKIHFASLEMSAAQLAARTVSAMSFETNRAFEYAALRRRDPNLDRALIRSLAERIPKTIQIDDRAAQTLAMLEQGARQTRRALGGLDAIFVDHLSIMRAETREGRVQQVTELSGGLKALAKRFNVPVVALSQLSRANEVREDKRPTLADLRDSGSLEQDADAVIGVYREAYYLERAEPQSASFAIDSDFQMAWTRWRDRMEAAARDMELITLKQRHGATGTDKFEFYAAFDVVREGPRPANRLRVVE